MQIYREEHRVFRQAVRKFIEKEMIPYLDQWEEKGEFPREMWSRLGRQGYLCPWLPEDLGGIGADFEYSVIIAEELSRIDSGIGISLHSDIVAPYIFSYGQLEQKVRWLPQCATGELILAIAMTEPNAGSDLQGIQTTALKRGDEYVINGQKTFISNGMVADLIIVVAKTDPKAQPAYKGLSLLAVPADTPGLSRRKLQKMGLHLVDTAELFFEDCRVPKTHLLGEEGKGFFYLMEKLPQERLLSALFSQSLAESMLEDALNYARERKAFGRAIGDFQHNAFKLAEMATEVQLGRTFLDDLIAQHIAGKDIAVRVAMAKWWISEMANRVAYHALQLHGGYGYMEEYSISRRFRSIRAHSIFAGTTEVMKMIIARQMGLSGF
ncbi:MAG: acyl-CoA dehydrogenase family protein [Firmicutes bacterium]|nr:acyl-CoA dehydrogenase family protein [Bacillota bacterium]MCL5039598.1 acyl-CoA dehydrogenase family protein [Bacillota bacterium]